jgi:hypothetical protein
MLLSYNEKNISHYIIFPVQCKYKRAFLCGSDPLSGRSNEHRRQWILDRLIELTQSFAIDCAGYSLMSNHYHLVLYVARDEAQSWDADEVVKRWQSLFKGLLLADRRLSGDKLSGAERRVLDQLVDQLAGVTSIRCFGCGDPAESSDRGMQEEIR